MTRTIQKAELCIDWKAKHPPWNKLGPEIAADLKKVARGELVQRSMYRCGACGHLFDTKHGLLIHRGKTHGADREHAE